MLGTAQPLALMVAGQPNSSQRLVIENLKLSVPLGHFRGLLLKDKELNRIITLLRATDPGYHNELQLQ